MAGFRGAGLALGVGLFALGLSLHRSAAGTVVGRWSAVYALVLVIAAASAVLLVFRALRAQPGGHRRPSVTDPGMWAGLGVLVYGAGYLLSAAIEPATASRALDLNLLGSTIPVVVTLEWMSLALLVAAGLCLIPRLPARATGPATLAGALAVGLVGLEGVARAAAVFDPEIQGFPTNRALMWHRRFVRQNEAGFRDVEHRPVAAPGVRRLLVIGDSYAYGSGVRRPDDRGGPRLARALADRTGTRWEAIVAARPDTHTRHHLAFLARGLRFEPELVVLLYTFNDIDYLRRVTRRTVLTEHPRGFLRRVHPMRLAFANSFAAQELYARARHLGFRQSQPGADPYADSAAVREHIADLRRFVTQAEAAGAAVGIVPFDIGVAAGDFQRGRYLRFVSGIRDAGLPVWPVDAAFRDHQFSALKVGGFDSHPNALANSLLAEALLPWALGAVECSQHPPDGQSPGGLTKRCPVN